MNGEGKERDAALAGAFADLWSVIRASAGSPSDQRRMIERVRDAFDRASARLSEQPGGLIAGTFRLEQMLHLGTDHEILKVRQRDTGEIFVLKAPRADRASEQHLRDRLAREAQIASLLASDDLVTALLQLRLDDGRPALVSRWRGVALSGLAADPPIPLQIVRSLIDNLLSGLKTLHAAGLVHSDISPANLLLGEDGRLRIADFGLWLAQGESHAALGITDAGTPGFRAPEQTAEAPADPARDIHAAGQVIAWLVERQSLEAPDLVDLASRMTQKEPGLRVTAGQALKHLRSGSPEGPPR
ncbi:protein kinase domain-containing protein [Rhizobium halophytocola]|uniref:Type VI secretion system protein ImpN n=1 Tax=Rhizobium halophytocola TaxID=735519 RepID=A0ABS4E683_9HYPH|nr:protein kinase [Rhizobium halophytocola]MBP1853456.1 type VI secretion system protein ImpN [Rhizobium halophytocola]